MILICHNSIYMSLLVCKVEFIYIVKISNGFGKKFWGYLWKLLHDRTLWCCDIFEDIVECSYCWNLFFGKWSSMPIIGPEIYCHTRDLNCPPSNKMNTLLLHIFIDFHLMGTLDDSYPRKDMFWCDIRWIAELHVSMVCFLEIIWPFLNSLEDLAIRIKL